MYSIGITLCYFGKFPNYFPLWLKSAAANPTVDFHIYTDAEIPRELLAANIFVHQTTLAALEQQMRKATGCPEFVIPSPYKLCDYKPLYGCIFADDLKNYDYWGYCDADVIFGDLRKFFTDQQLASYDKLLQTGHLSIMRNTDEMRNLWRGQGGKKSPLRVFTSPQNFAYDEASQGFYAALVNAKKAIWQTCEIAGGFHPFYDRYRFIPRKSPIFGNFPKDYQQQIFYYKNGRCLRSYLLDGIIQTDEFAYFHFQKRRFTTPNLDELKDSFLCLPGRFVPWPHTQEVTLETIKQYHPYPGKLAEWWQFFRRKTLPRIAKKLTGKKTGFAK